MTVRVLDSRSVEFVPRSIVWGASGKRNLDLRAVSEGSHCSFSNFKANSPAPRVQSFSYLTWSSLFRNLKLLEQSQGCQ